MTWLYGLLWWFTVGVDCAGIADLREGFLLVRYSYGLCLQVAVKLVSFVSWDLGLFLVFEVFVVGCSCPRFVIMVILL